MNEITLQNLFESHLIKNNIQYEREFKTHAFIIDFKIKLGDKFCGVEVKSSKGNVFHMLGQLILAKKTFSHVYLLAPKELLEKIHDIEDNIDVGIITLKEGNFLFLKEPRTQKYYFNQPEHGKKYDFQKPKIKNLLVVDKDYSILVNFENNAFTYLDVVNLLKISRTDAYARIGRLLKAGLLTEVGSFNPKAYRVRKIVDWGTKIPLQ